MSTTERTPDQLIGRLGINDVEEILSAHYDDLGSVSHIVKNEADSIFTWDYSLARPGLRKLYEKAKTGQWNGTTELAWDTDVDLEKTVTQDQAAIGSGLDPNQYIGTPLEKWGDKEWLEFGIESRRWQLS